MVKGVVDRFSEEFVETRRKALDKFLVSYLIQFTNFLSIDKNLPSLNLGVENGCQKIFLSPKLKIVTYLRWLCVLNEKQSENI